MSVDNNTGVDCMLVYFLFVCLLVSTVYFRMLSFLVVCLFALLFVLVLVRCLFSYMIVSSNNQ
jgi:hypothetical protein